MDCSICSSMPILLRPPRNVICAACYEGARTIINLANRVEDDGADKSTAALLRPADSSKGLANALKWVKEMKDREDGLNQRLSFLVEFATTFKDNIHTDIQVKPGNNEPSVRAHRALLAARSDIFKSMLDSDGCKAPANDTITLLELNHEELESLIEFLYSGTLPRDKVEKHIYSLSIAADKYGIPFLHKFCELYMIESLNSSNALDVLEISDACSNHNLKETALNCVVKDMENIAFSPRFDDFVLKNPHLSVEITRTLLLDIKNR